MNGRTAVVAGSDGDIGQAVARVFSEAGYRVAGFSRAGRTQRHLNHRYTLDLSDPEAVRAAVERMTAEAGTPRIVVNAAGWFRRTADDAADTDVFKNNFTVAENVLKIFSEQMKAVDGARIITVGSWDGIYPNVNSYSYSVVKSAIRTLVRLYQKSFRETPLNFDLLLPGAVNTRMRKDKPEDKSALVQPEDVARVCLCLAELTGAAATEEIVIYPKTGSYPSYRPW